MRRESFNAPDRLSIEVSTPAGDVAIVMGEPGTVLVELTGGPEDDYLVEMHGSHLLVAPPRKRAASTRFVPTDVRIVVPDTASANVRTASGDVLVTARVSDFVLTTASGDLRIQEDVAGDLETKSVSGDLRLQEIAGNAVMTTVSGDVRIGAVGGDLRFSSTSGELRAASVAGSLEVRTVSGNLTVNSVEGHSAKGRSVSGDIRVGIPGGRTVDLDVQTVSGAVGRRLDKAASDPGSARQPLTITVKSVSGDVILENAR